jgi:hypothetical protein
MIRQDFSLAALPRSLPGTIRNDGVLRERTHVWEVRHAGLLGIKYEVAVRNDLVQVKDVKEDSGPCNKAILRDVVDATVLGYAALPRASSFVLTHFVDSVTETTTCVPLPHPVCSPSLAIS